MKRKEDPVVKARIKHAKALGAYLEAWETGNVKASLLAWEKVKSTMVAVVQAQQQRGIKGR